ncbi:MAG: protein-L-isoaspartate O-methyltransferase [bacterium]|nr:protein-L-isoaspartate O-methyltransferase [bacterium]
MALIDDLIKEKWLKTPRIIEAFRKIKRADFLPKDIVDLAELNEALSLGFGQTISQPLVVAFMLELLEPKEGDKILDVGSGSGWTSALLGEIVGERGKVIAIDIVPELVEFGKQNAAKYNRQGIVEFVCTDGSKGYIKEAPYDNILASAALAAAKGGKEDLSSLTSAREIPLAWKKQLKVGGIIVAPVGNSIWRLTKKSETDFNEEEYPGFVFVPLVAKEN